MAGRLEGIRRVLATLAIGTSLGYLVSSCAREGANLPSLASPELLSSAEGNSASAWHSLREPQSQEALSAVSLLCTRVDAMIDDSGSEGQEFYAPGDLKVCARALLTSLLLGDPGPFLDDLESRGAKPDRDNVIAVAKEFADWQLIEPMDLRGLSAREAYEAVWATKAQRWMVISEVRTDWVDVGRSMRVHFGKDAWDFSGVRSCVSSVVPSSGRPSPEQGQIAEGTPASAHVTTRVRYSDGNEGQLRINFMFLEHEQRWYPVSIVVGSESRKQWPFPFF